ncbi:hypothetical protein P5G50_17455 [Leifsonia sp. F6_8S_P_1B]|uniref:Tfp pilus assembly protein PilO n=1 Tax=Leifsonia williamsii TaxID=3035919 RepID=A0ABT8KFL5_9MICO|nr:hypothetical protein [Leifsonia williamsii]MDN4616239.1 hypothetical protein [Leifsonia williamsii]
MDRTRLWIIASVLAMAVVVVLGWVVGVQPQLDQASAADDQTAQVRTANTANAAVLARLKKDSEGLPELKKQLTALSASIPADRKADEFTDEIDALAAAAGVKVVATEVSDGQAYVPPADPGGKGGAGSGGSTSTSTSTSTATPSPAATPAPAATSAPAATAPVPGMPPFTSTLVNDQNFVLVPVSATVSGEYGSILSFVKALQAGSRLVLVDGVDVGPAASGSGYDGTISGFLYVLTTGAGEAAAG